MSWQTASSPPAATPVRVVTAASLFDGHDVAINIIRRLLQAAGAEVIHLGHDRSVLEIVEAAIEEDAHAVAVSSYQGGHMEFFRYLVDALAERGAGRIRVYGGGGGTILPQEIEALQRHGVARIFTPEDGRSLSLPGIARALVAECRTVERGLQGDEIERLSVSEPAAIARLISVLEEGAGDTAALRERLKTRQGAHHAPVVGFTGTGGAGKSSVVDELIARFRRDVPAASVGVLLVDPTRRRSGGALLGDRLRMNAIGGPSTYVRSLATRGAHRSLSNALRDALSVLQAARFDLLLVETAGIGQSDSQIVDCADLPVYVMTPSYGAQTQLEKIDMLDLAEVVILNKADRPGAHDALRDVRKQWRRNRADFARAGEAVPVFATMAHLWNDPGIEHAYQGLRERVATLPGGARFASERSGEMHHNSRSDAPMRVAPIPASRTRYLAEVAATVRRYHAQTQHIATHATTAQALSRALRELGTRMPEAPQPLEAPAADAADATSSALRTRYQYAVEALPEDVRTALRRWPDLRARYQDATQSYCVRGGDVHVQNRFDTLSELSLPKVALPSSGEWGEQARFLRSENLPGNFPFTGGVFPFRRQNEMPTRMFAGEGTPERTNRRFHYLAKGQPAARLSTAFDSVTLYGRDPAPSPDVLGKVGNAGVSVCTLDDAKKLYSGFDLCDPSTSVSMTINGPAPMLLAFFFNAAIDQQVEKHLRETGRLEDVRARFVDRDACAYRGSLPEGHDRLGLGLLGICGDEAVDAATYARIKQDVLQRVRGTVQADILKEDQAQNTCIFSTAFALRLMADVQAYFVAHAIRNFYSVSISGYHIAEAGATPITQLAFTLANAFTYCEHYLARGLRVDDFAPSFSFFFSNGLDAEYTVIGRVARRIWAIAMRDMYGAGERSQKLKYHIQTSGRSLHAQEMAFNDIRTTLQALMALQDRCNSLHTNAYDEAVTTPTEASVRRALAIQLIIQQELGSTKNENPLQGSYWIEQLTDAVEEAVLQELERLSERGGVLGAMERQYQRGKIQDESLRYESLKQSGEHPVIGVNTFRAPESEEGPPALPVARSSEEERRSQLDALRAFQDRHAEHARSGLRTLREAAMRGENVFEHLMETAKHASLEEMTQSLFEVGGRYRRAM